MKPTIVLLLLFPLMVKAQTNNQAVPDFKTILVTNWVKPGPYLRVVDGKLYNIAYSTNWGNTLKESGFAGHMSGGFGVAYSIKVHKVEPDKIVCGIYRQNYRPEAYTGEAERTDEEFVEYIVIYHYPHADGLITDQLFPGCLCMRVKNYNTNGYSFAALDCGTQYTNLVPVVKKTIIKLPRPTNSLSSVNRN